MPSSTLGRRCNGGVHARLSAFCVHANGRGLHRSRSRAHARRWLGLQRRSHSTTRASTGAAAVALALVTNPRFQLGTCAWRTRSTTTSCRRKPFWAVSDPIRTIPMVTHTRLPPAAVVRAQSSCAHRCILHGQQNENTADQAERSAHRPAAAALCGRKRPLCATVACEDLDAHLPSEYDGVVATADWYR